MTERPILFSGPMVRAILEGRKTQTRRLVKDPPKSPGHYMQRMWNTPPPEPDPGIDYGVPGMWCIVGPDYPDDDRDLRRCPFGAEGDRLWVREAHAIVPWTAYAGSSDDGEHFLSHRLSPDTLSWAVYREGWTRCKPGPWRSSIHMPRWASRITLEVTDVRAQQLQEINTEDIIAEGIEPATERLWADTQDPEAQQAALDHAYRVAFIKAWNEIYRDKPELQLPANPWVWCVSFKVI
jgi:hypothetical protein